MYQFAKQWSFGIAAVVALCLSFTTPALTQVAPEQSTQQKAQPEVVYHQPPANAVVQQGTVIIPKSAIVRPEDAGRFAHTNIKLFVPAGKSLSTINPENTFAEYPESISCVYRNGPSYAGCVPLNNGKNSYTGGWGAIALVDAYDYPTALADLKFFSTFFGVRAVNSSTFKTVYANSSFGTLQGLNASCSGVPPNANITGWDVEEALDIEWSHVMAPNAKIILVEACSNSYNDLLYAEAVAGIEVTADGGGDISNSWGSGEFAGEVGTTDDFFYRSYWKNITTFASAGDSGLGAGYPSSSPWVVSAGGTTINRDASGNFLSESCWAGSGGGSSAYEFWQNPVDISNGMGPWSNFQYGIAGNNTGNRQTPDMSFDADPASGVWVYDTDNGGTWFVVGGTSVSSPALAGLVNASNQRLGTAPPSGGYYDTEENDYTYSQLFSHQAYAVNFYDVTTGSNGAAAGPGYDQCTGIGSPRGRLGK